MRLGQPTALMSIAVSLTLICMMYYVVYFTFTSVSENSEVQFPRYEKRSYFNAVYTDIHHSRPRRTYHSYLLSLYTLEQLTMSSTHFYSLIKLAHAWNMTAVEPVICNSRMYGLHNMSSCTVERRSKKEDQSLGRVSRSYELDFRRLYNLSYLQHNMSKCMDTKMVVDSLDNFIEHSYREVVLVHFVGMPGGIGQSFIPFDSVRKLDRELRSVFLVPLVGMPDGIGQSFIFNSIRKIDRELRSVFVSRGTPIADCSVGARRSGLAQLVEDKLNSNILLKGTSQRNVTEKFRISKVVCVDFSNEEVSLHKLEQFIVLSRRKRTHKQPGIQASVVFTKWQQSGPLKLPNNSRIFRSCSTLWAIPHSEEVAAASKQFLTSLRLLHRPFISVHMRLERLYQWSHTGHRQGYLECCLQRFDTLMKSLSHRYAIELVNVVIIKDYGPFGSDSCSYGKNVTICLDKTERIVQQLQKWGYSFAGFHPTSFQGVPVSSGFVSLVEAHSLLSGEALVTLGFGSFQSSIIRKFTERKLGTNPGTNFQGILNVSDHTYRICPCARFEEKLNGLELGASCESETYTRV